MSAESGQQTLTACENKKKQKKEATLARRAVFLYHRNVYFLFFVRVKNSELNLK